MPKVKFGLSNVYIAPRTEEEEGAITYGTPVKVPGAVSASIEAESESSTFYADNIAYYIANSKTSKTIDLEVADIPRSILTGYLGYVEAEGGGILETSNPNTPHFALLFQVETDEQARKFCYYNCTAVESDEEYNTTEDTTEPTTSTLSVTSAGDPLDDGNVSFKKVSEATDANYPTFFITVTAPQVKAGE